MTKRKSRVERMRQLADQILQLHDEIGSDDRNENLERAAVMLALIVLAKVKERTR